MKKKDIKNQCFRFGVFFPGPDPNREKTDPDPGGFLYPGSGILWRIRNTVKVKDP